MTPSLKCNATISSIVANTQNTHTAAVRDDDPAPTVQSNQQLSQRQHSTASTSCCEQEAARAHHVETPVNHAPHTRPPVKTVGLFHTAAKGWINRNNTHQNAITKIGLMSNDMYIQQFIHWVHVHTHTQPFYGPFSATIRVSRCQKRTSGLYGARED